MRWEGWVVVGGKDYEARWSGLIGEVEEVWDFGAGAQKGEVGGWVYVGVHIHDWIGGHLEEGERLSRGVAVPIY